MTLSSPCWFCDKTAPMAASEASVSSVNSPSSVGIPRIGDDVNADFNELNAVSSFAVHTNFLFPFNILFNGAHRPAKFFT